MVTWHHTSPLFWVIETKFTPLYFFANIQWSVALPQRTGVIFPRFSGEHEVDVEHETRDGGLITDQAILLPFFHAKKRIPDRRSFPCLFLSWVPQALPPLRASRAKISPVMQTTKEQYISPFDGIFFFYITDQCFDIFPQSRFGSYSAPLFLCNNGRWHWWYTPTICWLLYFCHWKLTPLLIHSPIMCQSLWPGLSAMLLMC